MEKLMQYAWQHRLLKSADMVSTDGFGVEIIDPGWINTDAGPDFFNAKIRIGQRIWAGNIEIHQRASDWFRHGHHTDPAYDSVILHVVAADDMQAVTLSGRAVRQIVMSCDSRITALYNTLLSEGTLDLVCAQVIPSADRLLIDSWTDTLAYGRVQDKADRFNRYLAATGNDIDQAIFATVARALGFGHNSEPLERLALETPLRILRKHADSRLAIEAILLGQAGLIPDRPSGAYAESLRNEYLFMARKFSLTPLRGLVWKMSRMRPRNFPHRRIATLAALVSDGFRLMSRITDCRTPDDCRRLFDVSLTGYWATACSLTAPGGASPAALSRQSLDSLAVNAVVPVLYAVGCLRADDAMCERAFEILRALPPERNSIVTLFERAGIRCDDAYTSQALIQLRRVYCEQRKCFFCRIGSLMVRGRR